MGQMSQSPQSSNAGINPSLISSLAKPITRKTSTDIMSIISGYRATSVIDTPMRRLDVLEKVSEGTLLLRDTDYLGEKADIRHIHLEYAQAQALAAVLRDLQPPEEPANGNGKARA